MDNIKKLVISKNEDLEKVIQNKEKKIEEVVKKIKKQSMKKKIFLVISIIFVLLVGGCVFVYKNDQKLNNQNYYNPEEKDISKNNFISTESTIEPTASLKFSIPKTAIPLFEESTESKDQKTVWSFLKEKYEIEEERQNKNFAGNIVKGNNSDFNISLSGLDITTSDIQSGVERLDIIKQIEDKILNLGYKKINVGDKTNLFKLVDISENSSDNIFINGDQLFSVYSQDGDCEEAKFGGCYILISYQNNIEKQISSQLNILTKLAADGTGLVSSLIKYGYIANVSESKKIGEYIVFYFGKYNSDGTLILAKENRNGGLDRILDSDRDGLNSTFIDDKIMSQIPDDVLCTYLFYLQNSDYNQIISARCK
jgi:hypothetical protein